ncbi:MAG: cation:proton antiporter, partial [Candidatus Desulfofervidaceae bacterium]|nr:cation:proton antiporter [Candidatus Desulfofervidaceae bacterium]
AYGFLGPIFFFWVGYTTDLTTIFRFPLLTLALFLAAFLGKMLGVYLLSFNQTLTRKEAIAVGIGLNARLTTELIVAQLLFAAHLIDKVLFTALVAASAFSTISVPLLISFILDKWKEDLG